MNNLIIFIQNQIHTYEIFILREKKNKMKVLVPFLLMASQVDANQVPVKMIFKSQPRWVLKSIK